MNNYKKKYPLHDAVIKNDISSVKKLSGDLSLLLMRDSRNFTPLDLARFFNRQEILSHFNLQSKKDIKILFPESTEFKCITRKEFEKVFKIEYFDSLFFASYQELKETINQCPFKYHHGLSETKYERLGREYEEEINHGVTANLRIQWIDNTIGFGVFADENLEEGSFIGEYTGIVRKLSRFKEEETTYCVHYPTSFFSLHNRIIDSYQGGNILRFVNHSDIPNLYSENIVINKVIHVIFLTNQRIEKGTQLTIDYGPDYWKKRQKEIIT